MKFVRSQSIGLTLLYILAILTGLSFIFRRVMTRRSGGADLDMSTAQLQQRQQQHKPLLDEAKVVPQYGEEI